MIVKETLFDLFLFMRICVNWWQTAVKLTGGVHGTLFVRYCSIAEHANFHFRETVTKYTIFNYIYSINTFKLN